MPSDRVCNGPLPGHLQAAALATAVNPSQFLAYKYLFCLIFGVMLNFSHKKHIKHFLGLI